jgi:[acyl-carrier-protein] S-malonyltransferase
MGAELARSFSTAAGIFEKANEIVGFDLRRVCFEGPADELSSTTMSQPAIFVTSAAILEVLRDDAGADEFKADVTAGLSLGEYTALYTAGLIDFEDALVLVQKRGEAMQEAADATEGGMVSIIGLDEQKVRELCDKAGGDEVLAPVNFNCPGQIVISGSRNACERAEELAPEYGAMKAVRLAVGGAFHTEMMAGAASTLAQALSSTEILEPSVPEVIANISAEYYSSSSEIRDGLRRQLTCPILWQKCMERLLADGVEQFYEIGPGRVLTGLMRRINRKARIVNVSGLQEVKTLL